MEAPGTAPGSEKLHFDAVYRHSRNECGELNIGESSPLRKSETIPAPMDQQTVHLDGHDGVVRSQTQTKAAMPYGPLGLSLSVMAIAIAAIAFCCLVAILALLILFADIGREATTEFFQDLRFDVPLKTRLGAGVVSSLYVGVALATVAMAALRGRRTWPALVSLLPHRRTWRPAILPALATLVYAAAATTIMARMQDRHLMVAGPTDLLLISTLLTNLVILAPIAEELLFRGWIQTALRRSVGIWPSGIVTAILFAAIHYDANHRRFFLVLPLAIALGLVREISGSIRPTILLHATYNLIIVAITLAYA